MHEPAAYRMSLSRRDFLRRTGTAALASSWARAYSWTSKSADLALCRKLASDPLRPQYHLMPAHNWMNDPNGPIYFGGRYHMFHQYNPLGPTWGNMHWAHATSPDMIHWEHEPIALAPTPGGPDSDGVFSGSAVLDHGTPTVIYTGVAPPSGDDATLRDGAHSWRETQCLAVAHDTSLRTWKKLPDPVIAAPPPHLKVTGFRDPALWREGDNWMLVLGSGVRGKGGMVLLYKSPDLRHWQYLHPLIEGSPAQSAGVNPVDTGEMWECPDFFPVGDKHVLLISTMGKVRWKVGTYANQRFSSEKEGVVDWGSYYAAKTMLDKDGNRILWGWIPESRPDAELLQAGWAGVMSLPRSLLLNSKQELQTEIAPAAKVLRGAHVNASRTIPEDLRIQDLSAELELHLIPHSEQFSIQLESAAGEFVKIECTDRPGNRAIRIDQTSAVLSGDPGSPVRLHIFLDGSVLELFVNATTVLTTRHYKLPSGPLRLKVDGKLDVASLDVWQMSPITKDRLTGSLCS